MGLSLVAAISAQAIYSDLAFGLRYSASARDAPRDDLLSRRLSRVVKNQVEGVAQFAPLAILAGDGSAGIALGWILLAYATLQALGATAIRLRQRHSRSPPAAAHGQRLVLHLGRSRRLARR